MAIIASFILGLNYKRIYDKQPISAAKWVKKSEITIARDEHKNLIIFDKKTGSYTIYQDSISNAIFRLFVSDIVK